MFDFDKLDIECNTEHVYNSFVGIRRNSITEKMTFFLPKGFESFDINYKNVKNLFFAMYKTFKRFEADNVARFERMLDTQGRNRDNTRSRGSKGYGFTDEEENEVLLYSKIDIIDDFFKVYRELDIDSIIEKIGITEKIDYANIDRLLAEGVFLKNNAIFIDNDLGSKYVIETGITELVELYCYIYSELLIELDSDADPIIWEVANNFSYKYLTSLQSLFNEDTYESTILILKDCLDEIDRNTAYKDYLYYSIYEVIEQFLYGQLNIEENQGEFWGINNFSYVWEDMCNNFVLSDKSKEILYCDTLITSKTLALNHPNIVKKRYGGQTVYLDRNFDNNIYIEMDGHKRWLRPDIILKQIENELATKNPLEVILDSKTLVITKSTNKTPLNFGANTINVIFSIKRNSEYYELGEKIFNLFSNKFSNLYRTKGIVRGSLKGYRYKPKGNDSFVLTNIPKIIFEDIYQEVYNRGKPTGNNDIIYIIDWKYVPLNFFKGNSEKLTIDITKQLTYEFCMKHSKNVITGTKSQFCIPKYSDSEEIILDSDCEILSSYGIEVVTLNFNMLQRYYVIENINLS